MSSVAFGPQPLPPDYVSYDPNIAIGSDIAPYTSGILPESVIPDASSLALPGQLPGIPGGGASNGAWAVSDPSGSTAIYTDPSVSPTPNGGYMQALASIAASGVKAMTTFVQGSPSVGIPAAKNPVGKTLGVSGLLTTPTGATNWTAIMIMAALGVGGIFLLVKYA